MTTYLITRHPGAVEWAKRKGLSVDVLLEHLEPEQLAQLRTGDVVIGSLPVNLAARVCAQGARFINLSLDLPRELRGIELDADTLERIGASLEAYQVQPQALPKPDNESGERVLVCILSGQLAPNYIEVLQERPDYVYALASSEMKGSAQYFSDLLEAEGLAHEVLYDVPSDLAGMRHYGQALVRSLGLRHPQAQISLNATGGTKLMSLALVELFQAQLPDAQLWYTDTDHKCYVSLHDASTRPLHSVLDIAHALAVNGARYKRALSDDAAQLSAIQQRAVFSRWLASHIGQLADTPQGKPGFLSNLNKLVNAALNPKSDALLQAQQRWFAPPRGAWLQALEQAQALGLLRIVDEQTIEFCSLAATRYLRGGWLEEYAWLCAQELGIEHAALGVELEWPGKALVASANEMDVVLAQHNRLLVLECKTGRFGGVDGEGKEQQVLGLLDSLSKQALGSQGQRWLF